MTPEQIARAKIKAQKTKEDAADKPIIDVVLAIEEVKEIRTEKLAKATKNLEEVVKIEEKLSDEETFLAAKKFVENQGIQIGDSSPLSKIAKGLWKDFINLPQKFVKSDTKTKIITSCAFLFQIFSMQIHFIVWEVGHWAACLTISLAICFLTLLISAACGCGLTDLYSSLRRRYNK